jgi:hypothetical protein
MMAANAVTGASIAATAGIMGQAHGGLDFVPQTGTYLLKRGEAVLQEDQNEGLQEMLSNRGGGSGRLVLVLDGRVLGEVIGDLTRDGRAEIHERAIVS